MEPLIICKGCGESKSWDAFTIPSGVLAGTILYACYDCYLKDVLEDPVNERERRNAYARAYYHRTGLKTKREKKTPEQLMEARQRAAKKRSEKLKEYTKLQKIRKALELLEQHGFKVT